MTSSAVLYEEFIVIGPNLTSPFRRADDDESPYLKVSFIGFFPPGIPSKSPNTGGATARPPRAAGRAPRQNAKEIFFIFI